MTQALGAKRDVAGWAALLFLAGCSGSPPAGAPSSDAAPADRGASAPAAPSSGPSSGPSWGPSSAPSSTAPEPAPLAAKAIPQALRGRWGLVARDCTSTAGDAKGLLTVSADTLTFYESVAELGVVKQAGADSLTATYRFSGEGQSWTLDVTLRAADGGRTLIRTDKGPEAMPGSLAYRRCA